MKFSEFPTYILVVLLILSLTVCSQNRLEREIYKSIRKQDFLNASILCSEYQGKKYLEDCKKALSIAENEIEQILSQRQELPFFKLMIEEEKKTKIQELLKKNIHLGIRYRKMWNEMVERD